LIRRIEEKGHTYTAGGNLYYDVSTFPGYGKLALLDMDKLRAGARIQVDENKRNPADFVLWFTKSKFENQALVWDSPWGTGYPGWHIECSAMSMKYLGDEFDIHTGGIDHIPVHHTNEIAQSEGATGKKWVHYWLHNEFLVIPRDKKDEDEDSSQAKMSKSSGNFLTLKSLIDAGYDALDYRYFLLGAHYRSQVTFSWDAMTSAKQSRAALVQRVGKILESAKGPVPKAEHLSAPAKEYLGSFREAMENDLAAPRALSVLQTAVKDAALPGEEKIALVSQMDSVLALNIIGTAEKQNVHPPEVSTTVPGGIGEKEIEALIALRAEAKAAKKYAEADRIRESLKQQGIFLTDTPSGTEWSRQN
ncbi:MAG: cysteine--tRNA ligase, partial [Spirochaetaceae bacterium]|nr:cysteine--tRNA ligase [Spirochaetaceae bacterium]